MADSYASQLRHLCNEYYNQKLDKDAYRAQRKLLLDQIDAEFNKHHRELEMSEVDEADEESMLMRTIAFFKNTDVVK